MPNPKKPAIKEWLAYLQQEISPDKDAILIGHSV
jgi:predicted alpha/beta hydrolase family esterase